MAITVCLKQSGIIRYILVHHVCRCFESLVFSAFLHIYLSGSLPFVVNFFINFFSVSDP